MEKQRIVAFDFDGTLTSCDTLLAFIRYAKGTRKMLLGFLRYSFLLVMMKVGVYPNWKVKQQVFSYFFKGMKLGQFDALCQRFAKDHRHILRKEALSVMESAQLAGARVLVVSASIDNWVAPFFSDVLVLGTKIEVLDDRLTGRFLTKNCYGQEKVNRIKSEFPHREEYELIAYGDSRGDKEMLEYADEGHYKPFR